MSDIHEIREYPVHEDVQEVDDGKVYRYNLDELLCESCANGIYGQALSYGACDTEGCRNQVICPHVPCYKYCDDCARELNVCKQCGRPFKD